jgi:hypothetical protein
VKVINNTLLSQDGRYFNVTAAHSDGRRWN